MQQLVDDDDVIRLIYIYIYIYLLYCIIIDNTMQFTIIDPRYLRCIVQVTSSVIVECTIPQNNFTRFFYRGSIVRYEVSILFTGNIFINKNISLKKTFSLSYRVDTSSIVVKKTHFSLVYQRYVQYSTIQYKIKNYSIYILYILNQNCKSSKSY